MSKIAERGGVMSLKGVLCGVSTPTVWYLWVHTVNHQRLHQLLRHLLLKQIPILYREMWHHKHSSHSQRQKGDTRVLLEILTMLLPPCKVCTRGRAIPHFPHELLYTTGNTAITLETSLLRRLQAQTLPDATPPIGSINQFSKIAVTFEPIMQF